MRALRVGLAIGVAVLLGTAGCLGFVTGSEPLKFTATAATVSDSALQGTGFEEQSVQPVTLNRTIELQGEERELIIENHIASYRKTAAGNAIGMMVVVATPKAEVLGQGLNPIGRMDRQALLERMFSFAGVSNTGDITEVETTQQTVLGEQRDVSVFETTREQAGQQITVRIRMVRISHNDDYVIALGMYPKRMTNEKQNIQQLFGGITH
ncbi:MAG: DUF6517 family protein [Halobacteriales archaeon]|nr:DUF6517 family protein [Halobacteriales archaeon]